MRRPPKHLALLFLAGIGLLSGCLSPSFSEETLQFMESSWALYLKDDPGWLEARDQWIALGKAEQLVLMDQLFSHVVHTSPKMRPTPEGALEPAWLKPGREMVRMKEVCGPYLIDAMSLLEVVNENLEEACTSMLAEVADFDMVNNAMADDRGNPYYKARLVAVMARLDDPRAHAAVIDVLLGPSTWQARATAAEVLRNCPRDSRPAAVEALEKTVNDPDATVAANARNSLERLRSLD